MYKEAQLNKKGKIRELIDLRIEMVEFGFNGNFSGKSKNFVPMQIQRSHGARPNTTFPTTPRVSSLISKLGNKNTNKESILKNRSPQQASSSSIKQPQQISEHSPSPARNPMGVSSLISKMTNSNTKSKQAIQQQKHEEHTPIEIENKPKQSLNLNRTSTLISKLIK